MDAILPSQTPGRITLRVVREWVRQGHCFPMLTCYDATTAGHLWRAGLKTFLVGDSAAQVILGFDQSIFAPLDFLIQLTAAVRRGAPDAFVMADMPFMSYQVSDERAIENAGRFLTEGLADVVKLEVDHTFTDLVARLSRAGIPVVAHIGWRPQRVRYAGIRTAQVAGKTQADIDDLVMQALALEKAGAVMLLIEQCTAQTARSIIEQVSIPVIGCGAGPACHGHVVVLQDAVGLTPGHVPSFIRQTGQVGQALQQAVAGWVTMVESGDYLKTDHPYAMAPDSQV